MRVVLVGDPASAISAALVARAFVEAERAGHAVVAVVDCARAPRAGVVRLAVARAGRAAALRAFDPAHPVAFVAPPGQDPRLQARRHRVPLLVPPGRDLNAPVLVEHLRDDLRADACLSLVCEQRFREGLLTAFPLGAVNYHNALLPRHRGLRATGWSLYEGDRRSGFAYHRMTAGIDEGPVLLLGSVAVDDASSADQVERAKTRLGARALPAVLEAIRRGEPGREQTGRASYHSRGDLQRIRRIDRPETLDWDDLRRRVRAFDVLELRQGDAWYVISRLRRLGRSPRPGDVAFRTRDGVHVVADRIGHLPPGLHRAYERARAAARR